MRRWVVGGVLFAMACANASAAALDERDRRPQRDLIDLPRDVWNLTFVWTEPFKHIARETRRFDPVSGTWFGLLEGSMKSVERAAGVLLPNKESESPGVKSGKLLYRYSF